VEAELNEALPDLEIEVIEGGGGIFDVIYEDKLIFSKKTMNDNRFPEDGEITQLVKGEIR